MPPYTCAPDARRAEPPRARRRRAAAPAQNLAEAMAKKVEEYEMEFNKGMEETYATMSETVLQGLRRRLPVTCARSPPPLWTSAPLALILDNADPAAVGALVLVPRRVKFDWDNKASVHKLASELQRK